MNKLRVILDDIAKYKKYNINTNIKDRLDKVLTLYVDELNNSYSRIKCKKCELVVKELNK